MTRFYLMYPRIGAVIVWASVAAMIAAAFCGCQSIPTRVIVHVEWHK